MGDDEGRAAVEGRRARRGIALAPSDRDQREYRQRSGASREHQSVGVSFSTEYGTPPAPSPEPNAGVCLVRSSCPALPWARVDSMRPGRPLNESQARARHFAKGAKTGERAHASAGLKTSGRVKLPNSDLH